MFGLKCTLEERPTEALWDLVSGLLYQFHSQGIEEGEEPAPDGERALTAANEFELALEPGVLSPPDCFTAYFENHRDAERALRAIEGHLEKLSPVFEVKEVEQENYAEKYRQSFQPLHVPPYWIVRAPWNDPVAPVKGQPQHEVIIEPGMAFGTGTHETTRGCLELIAKAASKKPFSSDTKVLDFGCGSGILSIALKKLGAGTVLGVDIDPLAIDASNQNAERNNISISVSMGAKDYSALDGIVANILKNTLLEFAPSFHSWLKKDGFLILSGLLSEQEDIILENYTKLGFTSQHRIEQSGWVSLLLKKTS